MFIEPQNCPLNQGHQKKRPNSTGISGDSNHRDSNRRTNRARNSRPNDRRSAERDETSNYNYHANQANDQLNETTRDNNTQTGQNAHIARQTPTGSIKIAGGDNCNATHNDITIVGGNNYTVSKDNNSASSQLCREDVNIVGNNNNDIRIENDVSSEHGNAVVENRNSIPADGNDAASQQIPAVNSDLRNAQGNSNNPVAKNIPNGRINILVNNDNTIVIRNVAMSGCQRNITANKSNSDPYSSGSNDNSDDDPDEEDRLSNTIDNASAQDDERRASSINGEHSIYRSPDLFSQP